MKRRKRPARALAVEGVWGGTTNTHERHLSQHRRNNMQLCQGQGQGQGQHQFNQLNQCMRFPIEYNGLLCKTQSIQPTQSIQYIRYMPQYPICLVSDMNVINDFKILETYWTDSIGCICCID